MNSNIFKNLKIYKFKNFSKMNTNENITYNNLMLMLKLLEKNV